MGALNKRVYLELLATKAENARLRAENQRLVHECRLAYLEGLDQGRAALEVAS